MEGEIDANVPLDYIEFQLFPSQNRYEACISWGSRKELVTSGPLAQLLRHSDKVKNLQSNGSNTCFKLEPPENLCNANWFTKSTLLRFLHIIASSYILNSTNAIINEISQLEEARKFHLSLYEKVSHPHVQSEESDRSYSSDTAPTPKDGTNTVPSDASKKELLQAMDLRVTALRGELAFALDKAAGAGWSPDEIIDVDNFSQYFGTTELRKTLRKFIELNEENEHIKFPGSQSSLVNDSENHRTAAIEEDNQFSEPSQSRTPGKYGVSPAKAAQVERESSSESEESSYPSEENQQSVERSRALIRCASPRRSASPMRRIQIGRSGSRRSTPLTIKSLNYFPAQERIISHKDATPDSTDDQRSEPSRKSNNDTMRISVQDAVKLFESKQKEQTVDLQKARSLLNASIGANRAVLRRWSAGMGESSIYPSDIAPDKFVPTGPTTVEGQVAKDIAEAKPEQVLKPNDQLADPLEVSAELNLPGEVECSPGAEQEGAFSTTTAYIGERLSASAEWSRQKEVELNQLLQKMMETNPIKHQNAASQLSCNQKVPTEQRGGFYDHYKQKREVKLQGQTAGKKVEKEKQHRAMQKKLEERKAAIASKNASGIGGRENAKNPQIALKNVSQYAKSKRETSKPASIKKASQKSQSLPATRKSWSPTPSPRVTGTSPATTPCGITSAGTMTTCHRTQPPPSAAQSSPTVEGSELRPKPIKASPCDVKKNAKGVSEKKQQSMAKISKTTKTKVQTASVNPAPGAKPSFYSKMTKKSSVVPLESKPFLRKGSGAVSRVSPTMKTKLPSQPDASRRNSEDVIPPKENETVRDSSETVIAQVEENVEHLKVHEDVKLETELQSPQVPEEAENPGQVIPSIIDGSQMPAESSLKTEAEEETVISPSAWVEIKEEERQPVPCSDSVLRIESPTNLFPTKKSSPKVRHSLSQMLLEESSETDVIEWGNAEIPPSMIYQKEGPKGLKRLLKFARKSKADTNSTGWSSPSVLSEGEDDSEESKSVYKRKSESLRKKATLSARNDGNQKNLRQTSEENPAASELPARANIGELTAQTLSQKSGKGHASASMTTTKVSRSFFSLSAFKGRKQNDTKL